MFKYSRKNSIILNTDEGLNQELVCEKNFLSFIT